MCIFTDFSSLQIIKLFFFSPFSIGGGVVSKWTRQSERGSHTPKTVRAHGIAEFILHTAEFCTAALNGWEHSSGKHFLMRLGHNHLCDASQSCKNGRQSNEFKVSRLYSKKIENEAMYTSLVTVVIN